jgi:hypothetical protein
MTIPPNPPVLFLCKEREPERTILFAPLPQRGRGVWGEGKPFSFAAFLLAKRESSNFYIKKGSGVAAPLFEEGDVSGFL